MEWLEVRRLFAASLVNGLLSVEGTDAGENITIRATTEVDASLRSFVVRVGAEQTSFRMSDVREIMVHAGAGDDSVLFVGDRYGTLAAPQWAGRVYLDGGDGNDSLKADASTPVTLYGGFGNDTLQGGSSSDTLRGGPGADHLRGGYGRDDLSGGSGNDDVDGGGDRDRLIGGRGRDSFHRSDGAAQRLDFGRDDRLLGRTPAEAFRGYLSNGILIVEGTDGGETITVYQELEPADADPANNPAAIARFHYSIRRGDIWIDSGSVETNGLATGIRINAGGGDDVVDVAGRTFALPAVAGSTFVTVPVTVTGGDGNDQIYGGPNHDRLNGGAGDDLIDGGAGDDSIGRVYLGRVFYDPNNPANFPPEPGNDRLLGGTGDDVMDGGDGDDTLSGGDGADRVTGGGAGTDEVRGDAGADTFASFDTPAEQPDRAPDEPAEDAFQSAPTPGTPIATVEDGVLVVRGTDDGEKILVGQEPAPPGAGAAGAAASGMFFYALTRGEQTIFGSIPSLGRVTSVRVEAGGGDDTVSVASSSTDSVLSTAAESPTVFGGVTLPARLLGGDGNDVLTGGAANDEILGGAGDDVLSGAGGNDTLDGEGGADGLNGGEGDDTLSGGEGDDRVGGSGFLYRDHDYVLFDTSGVPAVSRTASPRTHPVSIEIIAEPGNDVLSGGGGNDFLHGGDGNDTADGGDGDDRVYGYKGDDVLRGGAGNDVLGEHLTYRLGELEAGADRLFGGEGEDTLFGGEGTDQIRGEADRDTFYDSDTPAEQIDRQPDEPLEHVEPAVIFRSRNPLVVRLNS